MDDNAAYRPRRTSYHDHVEGMLLAHRMRCGNNPLICNEHPMALTRKICQRGKVGYIHSVLQVRNVVANHDSTRTEGRH